MHSPIPQVNWSLTRPLYKKLSNEFSTLTKPYGEIVQPITKLMLDHLIIAIDEVDKTIDNILNKEKRIYKINTILNYLQAHSTKIDLLLESKKLNNSLQILKQITDQIQVKNRFTNGVQLIFQHAKAKRHVTSYQTLISHVMLESKATAEPPLSIMQIDKNSPFGQFFQVLCQIMGVVDLIVDAKSDFKNGFIATKFNLNSYLKLHQKLLTNGINFRVCLNFSDYEK